MKPRLTITSIGTPDVQTAVDLAIPLLLKFINETKCPALRLLVREKQGPQRR
jgi:hypothetical protein